MNATSLALLSLGFLSVFAGGCAVSSEPIEDQDGESVEYEQPFASDIATLMDFDFDGELVSSSAYNTSNQIRAQLLFTIGHFNGEKGVSRLDKIKTTNVTTASIGGGLYRIRYHVKLPVAWGSKTNLPTSYALTLPRRVDVAGQSAFVTKYGTACDDGDGHANADNFWYHYRPKAYGCALAAADVVKTTATAAVSTQNSVAKYPEYHEVWRDGALNVVAIFGKYEDGATTSADAGIAAYDEFIGAMKAQYPQATTVPAVSSAPGVSATDVTFSATLPDGRRLQIVTLLVDNVRTAGAAFDARYAELSPGADLIVYGGHAGLGANVRALSTKGKFFPGKYQIFFMNGCDTFAYVDGALAQTRAALNPDDPNGTKYMEIVTNAMPAYFMNMSESASALIRALLTAGAAGSVPKSYGTIFREVDASQVVVVTGEEDNVFKPGRAASTWAGFHAKGVVNEDQTVAYQTDVLPAGRYVFAMTPEGGTPGGDADLYLRVGTAPTATATYKCKSYVYNSNERCAVTLTAPARVHMIAKGDKAVGSQYRVDGWMQ